MTSKANSRSSGHVAAFNKWFVRYEIERKKKHISCGLTVPGFEKAPPGPDEVRRVIFNGLTPLNERLAAKLCGTHRTTISRWLDGSVQIPSTAYVILLFYADGIPPGCGDAWRGFQWLSDGLICPDGKTHLSAREISGQAYQKAYITVLEVKCSDLENKLIDMTRRVDWGSTNDAFVDPQDVRSKAFHKP